MKHPYPLSVLLLPFFFQACDLEFDLVAPEGESTVCISAYAPSTKSSIGVQDNRILNLNVFFYRDGKLFAQAYSESQTLFLTVLCGSEYDVFALSNVGKIDAPLLLEDLENMRLSFDSMQGFDQAGLPMACRRPGKYVPSSSRTSLGLELERLVARYSLSIDSELQNCSFEVKSVRVRQSAMDVLPFRASSTPQQVEDGDEASFTDVALLNAGGRVFFYVLENCEGVLLPSNADSWGKVPSNIDSLKARKCTYLQMDGRWKTEGAESDLSLKMFLGQDNCSDFSVVRNTSASIDVCLSDRSTLAVSWKVSMENLSDSRSLSFDEDQMVILQNSGWNRVASLHALPLGLEYLVETSDSLIDWKVEEGVLYVSSQYDGEQRPCADLVVSTWDGFKSDTLSVKVDYELGNAPSCTVSEYSYYQQYGKVESSSADVKICIGDTCFDLSGAGEEISFLNDSADSVEFWMDPDSRTLFMKPYGTSRGVRLIIKEGPVHQYVDIAPASVPSLSYDDIYLSEAGCLHHDNTLGLHYDGVISLCLWDEDDSPVDIQTFRTPQSVLEFKGLNNPWTELSRAYCDPLQIRLASGENRFGVEIHSCEEDEQIATSHNAFARLFGYGLRELSANISSSGDLHAVLANGEPFEGSFGVFMRKLLPPSGYVGEVVNYEVAPGNMRKTFCTPDLSASGAFTNIPFDIISWSVSHYKSGNDLIPTAIDRSCFAHDAYSEGAVFEGGVLRMRGMAQGYSPVCGPMVITGTLTNPHSGLCLRGDYVVDVVLFLSCGANIDYDDDRLSWNYVPFCEFGGRACKSLWDAVLPEDIILYCKGYSDDDFKIGSLCIPEDSNHNQYSDRDIQILWTTPQRVASDLSWCSFIFDFSFYNGAQRNPLLSSGKNQLAIFLTNELDIRRNCGSNILYGKYADGGQGYYHIVRQCDVGNMSEAECGSLANMVVELGYSSLDI